MDMENRTNAKFFIRGRSQTMFTARVGGWVRKMSTNVYQGHWVGSVDVNVYKIKV